MFINVLWLSFIVALFKHFTFLRCKEIGFPHIHLHGTRVESVVKGRGERDKVALVVIMEATVMESGIPFVSTKCTYLLNHAISHPTSAYRQTERQTDRRTFSFDSYLSFQFQLLVMQ